jgi:hypothetical protein
MKKLLISVAIVLGIMVTGYAQTKYEQNGNVFKAPQTEKTIKKGDPPMKTPFFWENSQGKWPIYLSNGGKGSAFIIRTSKKTGKEYKAYLGKEVTQDIKKQLKIEQ